MSGLIYSGGILWFYFLTTVALEQVKPPGNVSLEWEDGLYQTLTWTPPMHSMEGCYYQINSTIKDYEDSADYTWMKASPWMEYRVMNGGFLHISIQTVCGSRKSEAVVVLLNDTDLQLSCLIMSSTLTHCSWKTPPSAQLNFFYNLQPSATLAGFDGVRECPHYNSMRTGCDLQVHPNQQIDVLLNGTVNNRTIRNVFRFTSLKLHLPPLHWEVKESEDQFKINWTMPEFENLPWKYKIQYIDCENSLEIETSLLFAKLGRVAECPYNITMRGFLDNFGGTEWTTYKHFGVASGPNKLVFAVVLIPLVLALQVILTLCCCMKHKDKIFPKVPQPNSALFKDLMNNNNKINAPNFYSPKVEEDCQVTLVIDPNHSFD